MTSNTGPQYCCFEEGNGSTSSAPFFIYTSGDTAVLAAQRKPASAADSGKVGEICFGVDSGVTYLYYCTAANTWQRVALATWTPPT